MAIRQSMRPARFPEVCSLTDLRQLKKIIKARQDDFCKAMSGKLLTYALGGAWKNSINALLMKSRKK